MVTCLFLQGLDFFCSLPWSQEKSSFVAGSASLSSPCSATLGNARICLCLLPRSPLGLEVSPSLRASTWISSCGSHWAALTLPFCLPFPLLSLLLAATTTKRIGLRWKGGSETWSQVEKWKHLAVLSLCVRGWTRKAYLATLFSEGTKIATTQESCQKPARLSDMQCIKMCTVIRRGPPTPSTLPNPF